MVKADSSADYYGDLGCIAGADAATIKKSFRNLALKYHPDRNPGKEAEVKNKFQAIQAAHEILTDPQQKAKYDADRLRQGTFAPNYNTPTRPDMPPRGATTAFGPPPRRAPPGPAPNANAAGPKPFFATPGATAGPRYATRNRPGYPPYEPTEATPKQSDHYTAFQNMRQPRDKYTPNGKTQRPREPPREPFSPNSDSFGENTRTHAPRTPSGRTPRVPPGRNDPRKAAPSTSKDSWDEFVRDHQAKHQQPVPPAFGRSNTTRLPKKNGFAPSMSRPDEPPAQYTSAYHHVNRPPNEKIQTHFPPPPPRAGGPAPTRKSRPPSPDRPRSYHSPPSDDPLSNSDRLSTPYATSGGERTYFSSQGVGRSKSVRMNQASAPTTAVPPYMKTSPIPPPSASSRHRSASPRGLGRSPRYYPNGSDSSSGEDDPRTKYAHRRASHDHRATSRRSPAAHSRAAHRHSRKESEDSDEDVPTFKPPKQYPDGPPRSRRVSANPDQPEGFLSHRARVDAERSQHSTPSTAHAKSPLHTSQPWNSEYPKPVEKSKSWYEAYGSKEDGNKRKEYDRPTTADAKESPNIFNFPSNSNVPSGNPVRPSSTENIDTNFSSSAWHGQFRGSAEDYLSAGSSRPGTRRASPPKSRASPTKGRSPARGRYRPAPKASASSDAKPADAEAAPPPLGPQPELPVPNNVQPAKEPEPAKFSPEKWSAKFKEPTWVYQAPPPQASPAFGASAAKRNSKTPSRKQSTTNRKRPVVPKPATVTPAVEDPTAEEAAVNGAASGNGTTSGHESDAVSVSSAMDIDSKPTPPTASQAPSTPNGRQPPMAPPPPANLETSAAPPATSPPKPSGPPTNPDPAFNLTPLQHTHPLAPTNTAGLADLSDLATPLPFPSKPSSAETATPTKNNKKPAAAPHPQRLALPAPPKAPIFSKTLSKEVWVRDLAFMSVYMYEWNVFQRKMLEHFNARLRDVEGCVLGEGWVGGGVGVDGSGEGMGDELGMAGDGMEGAGVGGDGDGEGEDGGGGFEQYEAWLEEDSRVRTHWDVGWELHRKCVAEWAVVRGRVGDAVRGGMWE